MDVFVVVPARGGSKRLPGKNLRPLAGRSLIGWAAKSIADAGLTGEAVLSTDDPTLAEEGRRCGLAVPFLRPAELATDDAPSVDTVLHAVEWKRAQTGRDPEAVLVLQPTSPLRGSGCIVAAMDLLGSRSDINSVIAMTSHHLPPRSIFLASSNCIAEPLGRDGRAPVYLPNGAIYLTRTVALRAGMSLYANPVMPLVIDQRRAIDIDTEADWQQAKALLAAGLPEDSVRESDYAPVPSTDPSAP